MNSKERFTALLRGEKVDYTPIFPKTSFATSRCVDGMSILDYMTSETNMAAAIIASAKKYGYDAVGITTDIANEGMAIGSVYERPKNSTSKLTKYYLDKIEDYEKVSVTNPLETEPTKTIIGATKIVKKAIGDKTFVTAWCNGALNVASQLYPMQELLYTMIDEPELLHKLLDRCCAYSENYARQLVRNGADGVSFGHAMASCSVISPSYYEEFALPYEKRLVNAIHEEGGVAITHICGNITMIADKINTNGSEIIDFDHCCDLTTLLRKTTKILRGNIDPA
ncbi:MAG: uroporphyrinogen decarboxylase family protein, partial [Clostridia bacterium]